MLFHRDINLSLLMNLQCDQPKEGVVNNPARMDDYCRERGFSGWFETSAKENINIDEASRFLVNRVSILYMSVSLSLAIIIYRCIFTSADCLFKSLAVELTSASFHQLFHPSITYQHSASSVHLQYQCFFTFGSIIQFWFSTHSL